MRPFCICCCDQSRGAGGGRAGWGEGRRVRGRGTFCIVCFFLFGHCAPAHHGVFVSAPPPTLLCACPRIATVHLCMPDMCTAVGLGQRWLLASRARARGEAGSTARLCCGRQSVGSLVCASAMAACRLEQPAHAGVRACLPGAAEGRERGREGAGLRLEFLASGWGGCGLQRWVPPLRLPGTPQSEPLVSNCVPHSTEQRNGSTGAKPD